ncbi:MAG: hypothetical protein SCK28_14040, partial [Bacillota bacterium]|nr:hypothetical protein [Bacillota bacterium]
IQESIAYLKKITAALDYPLVGNGMNNYLLPTSFGTIRPTALVPTSMDAGDIRQDKASIIIGVQGLLDFPAKLIADRINIARSRLGLSPHEQWLGAEAISLQIEAEGIRGQQLTPLALACWLQHVENLELFISKLKSKLSKSSCTSSYKNNKSIRIGVPAILGSSYGSKQVHLIEAELQCPVFEIPVGQPTLPGIRLYQLLLDYVKGQGIRVQMGVPVISISSGSGTNYKVTIGTPGKPVAYGANYLVIATGGSPGASLAGQEVPLEGMAAIAKVQPNLMIVGRALGGYDPAIEKNGLGVALATGYFAGKKIAEGESCQ